MEDLTNCCRSRAATAQNAVLRAGELLVFMVFTREILILISLMIDSLTMPLPLRCHGAPYS